MNRFELLQLTTQTLLNSQNVLAAALQLEQSALCIAAAIMLNTAPGATWLNRCADVRLPSAVKRSHRSTATLCRSSSEGLGTVHLLDYGAGNVRSVKNAIRRLGYNFLEARVVAVVERESSLYPSIGLRSLQVESVDDIAKADRLVFPGVGSYGQAMERLKQLGYTQALKDYIQVQQHAQCICD